MSGDEARDSRENFMTYGNSIILFMLSIDLITRPGFTLRGLLRFARYCAYHRIDTRHDRSFEAVAFFFAGGRMPGS
jgi:hypothetical protein